MPVRIFDDLSICELRAKFSIDKSFKSKDPRLEYERKNDIEWNTKQLELYFKYKDWVKIVGIPDGLEDSLAIEFTITRTEGINHIILRSIIYSYMCMKYYEYCSTAIISTTPGEQFGTLVIPNAKALDYAANLLYDVLEGEPKGKRIKFCPSCLYRRICEYG
ncbi:hypothetical protein [Metallosphaera javensis (ex Sakai et al. 2022)]|uniref:hypothetical protein n=1 Tax=Metallosphaera javensis (ex Sakai et al. 2022) TaxID=2775498 RepID=UPI00258AEFF1|nr:MAG: hypothetical protein MjAS7_2913 [Metallosphaera javensis (ex Sakai et al. 2022)]